MKIICMFVAGVIANLLCEYGYGGTPGESILAYMLGAIIGAVLYEDMPRE